MSVAWSAAPVGRRSARSSATTRSWSLSAGLSPRSCHGGRRLLRYARSGNVSVMSGRLCVPLSVLDLCPVPTGESAGEALRRSVDLARHAERWGLRRYWVAEHHSMPGIASSAPAVLAGRIASATSAIRVGSGGVVLPHHSPPPRADRSGDRAGSRHGQGDRAGAAVHRGRAATRGLRHAGRGTAGLLRRPGRGGRPGRPGPGDPAEGTEPAVWLLGSTGYSAELAGLLGLPFAFAYHFSAANARPALALYRRTFTPSARLGEPYCLISVSVLCAEDAATAQCLHGSSRLSMLRLRAGRPSTLPSPQEAAGRDYSAAEQTVIAEATGSDVVGDPDTVTGLLDRLVSSAGADALKVTTDRVWRGG